ncbi:DUF2652 domain-containing protein [Flavobacterium hydatis]|uniref:DUF2652 domain-containing protein n=1 Tax=Flavobacterium hydatis TaxID=991 RepID=A0A086AED1_FLAHY|nr:DUF2652 domain-containing protein [Flavobacterium hydatis]KFF15045.1 hypothetical protein IW20_15380 [Flavobacterium hydatis]OXA92004.1 hypothetical protein B0A62_16550 [Flavobacterium hydatis]
MEEFNTLYKTGMVMIPDISGFTNFVINTNMTIGKYITESLLKSIINSNTLSLEVSEIEGDAILFYKYHKIPSFDSTLTQIETMYNNFKKEVSRLSLQLTMEIPLSLKIIVHYGTFTRYKIGKFEKLYGAPVVEAHKMLKNHIAKFPPYALFSDAFLKANFEQPAKATIEYDTCDNCMYLPEIGYIHYL